MNDSRTSLRRGLHDARSSLSESSQADAAQALINFVVSEVPETVGVVAGYIAHGGELRVSLSLDALLDIGWSVVLPRCGTDAAMEFCPWSPSEPLQPNRYGIGEPLTSPIPIETITAMLVPGVGFDIHGARIGHGVGYYDRFLARYDGPESRPLLLGVAHDLQLVELPKPEPWDIPMDRILTPTKVINTSTCE